ncbi:MAG TPA: NAD(P)-dependent oxidoreductase [Flavitalea sp.]|nr:NAD(P)-dependent oxidoreductase [Flavitalea sp.]
MRQKILITGGSGFIGTNTVAYLVEKGYDVLNLDICAPVQADQLQFFKLLDIMNISALEECVRQYKPDYIIHMAAKTDLTGRSIRDYEVNIKGTENIIEASKNIQTIKKIVFTSSMLVCKTAYYPSHAEDFNPSTTYGQSKVDMEKLIRRSNILCDWVILRPTSIWGPWFKTPYRDFFDTVSKNKFIDIGSKYGTKTYGYIGNTVYQIHQLLLHPSTHSNVYYLGDEPPVFISEWARQISEEMGTRYPKKVSFSVLKITARIGDVLKIFGIRFPMTSFRLQNMTTNNIIDLSATYSVASHPPYTRTQGIKKTVAWLRDNKNR